LTAVASNDDDPAGGKTSFVSFNAVSNVTYQIAVAGFGDQSKEGNIVLKLQVIGASATLGIPQLLAGGNVQFMLAGAPGRNYRVQFSPDLSLWTNLITVTNINGTVILQDPAAGQMLRFYRAVTP